MAPPSKKRKGNGDRVLTAIELSQYGLIAWLPKELRENIYSFLFSEQYTYFEDEDLTARDAWQELRFPVNVFTASKAISAESLEYFHSDNAFVVLDTNWAAGFIENVLCHTIPLLMVEEDMQNPTDYALKIELTKPSGQRPRVAVFSGR